MADTLDLTLTDMAAGGDAVGFAELDRRPVFVPGGIPGERVRVQVMENRPRWRRARLLDVLAPSPDRIAPLCPHFAPASSQPHCTGCRWQHVAYERQLTLKRDILVDILARHAKLGPSLPRSQERAAALVDEVIALGDPEAEDEAAVLAFGYCTQMHFILDPAGRLALPDQHGAPLPIDACPLHHPQLAALFAAWDVDPETGSQLAQELTGVTLAVGGVESDSETNQDGQTVGALVLESARGEPPELTLDLPVNVFWRAGAGDETQVELLVGDWTHPVAVGGRILRAYPPVGARRLTWPHVLADEALYAIGVQMLELQPFEQAVDLWAGIGVGSLALAEQAATVLALDDDPLAAAALEANLAGVDNISPRPGPILEQLAALERVGHRAEAALLTPPQTVDWEAVCPALARLGVKRAVIITADPVGLARSLGSLAAQGFQVQTVQPVDIAPHQPTTALVVRFNRVEP
ncbi:MAG: class I SAM-dependent RNA methyltransferase [Caldilineae bacterium]|nr:MAG: class I SAM-dependent RNA methyltransferase [Caldilineae bacterium]